MPVAAFHLESASATLRSLPTGSYLVHATNCLGEWGAGFALELRGIFPGAYLQYRTYCDDFKTSAEARYASRDLVGHCYIIPPQDADIAAGAPEISIVCLFTSHGYGRPNKAKAKPGVDRPALVLGETKQALRHFREQLDGLGSAHDLRVYSPMFNSGAFKVPWAKTSDLIRQSFDGWQGRWIVLEPPPRK
ncbi:uncharacterized protein B0I36DRAFT_344778 [Microdochium trichocladiopsis]|uniref:ADP-ribose 1''-phosphate phosphatase n=1 Tax=Microdochium trichocladiopsis TaxID=1682393 RepID=A0A9P8YIS5_9PEZI|nr:uncharacterized protein B0I36DRAFT_344778 [Microdochium trichocladiopsis]KAH7041149.1 hypothetical protein B0I36DRAFT_344778 [Microdochium trichocladiopsis]